MMLSTFEHESLLYILVGLITIRNGGCAFNPKTIPSYIGRWRQVSSCPASMNHAAILLNHSVLLDRRGDELLTATFRCTRDAQSFTSMTGILRRCRDTTDQCEHFSRLEWKHNICPLLPIKNAVWSSIIEQWEPKMTCPFKKAIYTGGNMSFDYDFIMAALGVPNGAGIWGLKGFLRDENSIVHVCFDVFVELIKIRRKHYPSSF
ncbi:uncharacterized protein LOC113216788 [Frankliniella occidentalis]|uniref:Uncharacterized protein LOC113216788 n=1 Tax=Frankliniella occidentalis TaxID=133901 RepID=A0A9C6TNC2_FRAOC|nr:uncharacterized protein LOC113216788 [Frankliniella occidentalis]